MRRAGRRRARSNSTHDAWRHRAFDGCLPRDDDAGCHANNAIARSLERAESRSNALHPATMCPAVGHADFIVSSANR